MRTTSAWALTASAPRSGDACSGDFDAERAAANGADEGRVGECNHCLGSSLLSGAGLLVHRNGEAEGRFPFPSVLSTQIRRRAR